MTATQTAILTTSKLKYKRIYLSRKLCKNISVVGANDNN